MTEITQKITYKLRKDIASKLNRLPMKYFDRKTHGEVLSIITNDIEKVLISEDELSAIVKDIGAKIFSFKKSGAYWKKIRLPSSAKIPIWRLFPYIFKKTFSFILIVLAV